MLIDTVWALSMALLIHGPKLPHFPALEKHANATIPLSYGKAEFDAGKITHDSPWREFLKPSYFCITLLFTHLHDFTFSVLLKCCFHSSFKLFLKIHIFLINIYSLSGTHLLSSSRQSLMAVFMLLLDTVGKTHIQDVMRMKDLLGMEMGTTWLVFASVFTSSYGRSRERVKKSLCSSVLTFKTTDLKKV